MSNDVFLHAGLTPATDVELYPSLPIGGAVGSSRSLEWRIATPVGSSLGISWGSRAIVGSSRSTSYRITSSVGASLGIGYRLASVAGASLGQSYAVRGLVGSSLDLRWRLGETIVVEIGGSARPFMPARRRYVVGSSLGFAWSHELSHVLVGSSLVATWSPASSSAIRAVGIAAHNRRVVLDELDPDLYLAGVR